MGASWSIGNIIHRFTKSYTSIVITYIYVIITRPGNGYWIYYAKICRNWRPPSRYNYQDKISRPRLLRL